MTEITAEQTIAIILGDESRITAGLSAKIRKDFAKATKDIKRLQEMYVHADKQPETPEETHPIAQAVRELLYVGFSAKQINWLLDTHIAILKHAITVTNATILKQGGLPYNPEDMTEEFGEANLKISVDPTQHIGLHYEGISKNVDINFGRLYEIITEKIRSTLLERVNAVPEARITLEPPPKELGLE